MRSPAVIGSLLLHLLVGLVLAGLARRARHDEPTAIEMMRGHEPQAATPAEVHPEPRRPPRPSVGAIAPARAHEPRPIAPPPSTPEPPPIEAPAGPAPIDTGLQLGNQTGDGIALPGGGPRANGTPSSGAPSKTAQPVKRTPVAQPVRTNDAPCTEEPSRPLPLAKTTAIEYTPRAQADGVEGRLVLDITVAADGSVERVEVAEPVEPSLDAAAVAAVKTWRFRPASRCGKPVGGGVFSLARRFELGD